MTQLPKILRYAYACAYSYLEPENMATAFAAIGMNLVQPPFFGPKDCVVVATTDAEHLYFTVRGSKTGRNWRSDLEINARPLITTAAGVHPSDNEHIGDSGAPWIHAGIHGEWDVLAPWMNSVTSAVYDKEYLESNIRNPHRTIELLGHSAGGGVVLAATVDNEWATHDLNETWTYGALRIGFKHLAKLYTEYGYDKTTYRVVHDDDIVPTVPPWPYEHVGQEIRLNNDGDLIPNVKRSFFRRLFGIEERIRADIDGVAVREHFEDNYIAAIEKYVAKNKVMV